MPYSTKDEVETWGQFVAGLFGAIGLSENAAYQHFIASADGMIDNYCNRPAGFFTPGGVEIQQEYLNGTDVAYMGGITKFFNWYYGGTSKLAFKQHPVLSVTKLEEETSAGTWTARTEGTGNDFIVVDDGVRYVTNTPSWKYKNVRATYKAGYVQTPWNVSQCSARLTAALMRQVKDASKQSQVTAGILSEVPPKARLPDNVFTPALKGLLENHRRLVYAFV